MGTKIREFYKVKVEIEYFDATYKIIYFISIFDYCYAIFYFNFR